MVIADSVVMQCIAVPVHSDIVPFLVQYLLELTLVDGERFLKYLPSGIATCCVYMSLHTLGFEDSVSTSAT